MGSFSSLPLYAPTNVGSQHRGPLRIEQAESDRVDELARLVERADRLPVQPPLLAAQFLELLFVHKSSFWLLALELLAFGSSALTRSSPWLLAAGSSLSTRKPLISVEEQ